MRLIHTSLFVAIATLGLSACNPQPEGSDAPAVAAADAPAAATPAATPAAAETAPAAATDTQAVAELASTAGNTTKGSIRFSMVDGRIHARGEITGLKPNSEHGFHIHEKGDCSAPDATSAGGHFNPGQQNHGSVGAEPHHGGDMPNIKANAEGVATVDGPVSNNVNLGKGNGFDIIGRGLIVHADPDDYTSQPTGNAGARLACAVITRLE